MSYTITTATFKDVQVISDFQLQMALETENINLNAEVVKKGVEAVFKFPEKGKYYVVLFEDNIISSFLTTYEWSDWRCADVIWIQSVFVIPEFRRKGVFTLCYNFLKNIVKTSDGKYSGLRLYVDKTNISAKKTYDKVGMNCQHYTFYEDLNF